MIQVGLAAPTGNRIMPHEVRLAVKPDPDVQYAIVTTNYDILLEQLLGRIDWQFPTRLAEKKRALE